MKNLQNLIVAVDPSPGLEETVAYALALSKDLGATLRIMLCYEPSDPHAKEKVKTWFEHLEANLLQDTPVHYHLTTSDQPVPQTLTALTGIYHPDLLITALPDEASLACLIENTSYPLMIIPPKASYKKIQDFAVTYDAKAFSEREPFSFISQLAKHYRAFVRILELDHTASFTERYNSRNNRQVDHLLKEVKHHFHFLRDKDIIVGILKFLARRATDLLVVLSRRQLPDEENPLERHSVKIARLIPKPLLICKV